MTVVRYRRPPELDRLGTRHAVVEASAGTGKTFVLEHLVVDLLLRRGARLDEILVVTFTEKATAELNERVRRKLEELAELTADHPNAAGAGDESCWLLDQPARQRLREAVYGFDRASILTIHGFCQRLLSEHAFFNRRLFDEEAIDEEEALATAFAGELRAAVVQDPTLAGLLAAWKGAGGDWAGLRREVGKTLRALAGLAEGEAQPLEPSRFDAEAALAGAQAFAALAFDGAALDRVGRRIKINGSTKKALMRRLDRLLAVAGRCTGVAEVPRLLAELDQFDREEKSGGDPGTDYLLAKLGDLDGQPEVAAALSALRHLLGVAPSLLGALVARFGPRVAERLEAQKRQAGRYDFQDMLTLVGRSLAGEDPRAAALLAHLRARFRYALIDEFQDTDEVQWGIFRRIFFEAGAGHVLTVIGDPKQAIYAFRGADVFTYLRAKEEIVAAGGELLFLQQNFRSTASVIDAYNAIFDQAAPFFPATGGIRYDHPVSCGRPEAALFDPHGRPLPGAVVLEVTAEQPKLLTWQVKRSLLGALVTEIASLLDPGSRPMVGSLATAAGRTPIGPQDIFVLTRTIRESREVGEALRQARLPFAYFKQEKLFSTVEAREVLDLLRAIADPDDRTARARAFITPFFGLGLPDLLACEDLEPSEGLLRLLYDWRALGEAGDFETLFAAIVEQSGMVCRELFFRDTERSLTNYLHLFEILQEEAARTRVTLRELCQILGAYILGTRRPPGVGSDIQRLETEAAAVQIMTIHHAKGLEAAVVFVYGGFWPGPTNNVLVVHDESRQRVVRVGRVAKAIKDRHEAEQLDEERRVLYVALTRAKARLYLPRYPQAFEQLRGAYKLVNGRLADLLDGFAPEGERLFQRQPVPCPGVEPAALAPASEEALGSWQPPRELLQDEREEGPYAEIAALRPGFFTTSYSAVKRLRRAPGPAADLGPDPAGEPASEEPEAAAALEPLPPDELAPGRLSGRFLHEVLEEVPLGSLAGAPDAETWARQPDIAALFEQKRRRHDCDPAHLPHARRMVFAALANPLVLGGERLPALGSLPRLVREMEFVFPIPEAAHHHHFTIERGVVKGYIDVLFEHAGKFYVCDWKGDRLPAWQGEILERHCQAHYAVQAQLYTVAALRLFGVDDAATYQARFGGIVYVFLRGLLAEEGGSGIYFERPTYGEVLAWQREMLSERYWGRS